MKRIVSYLLTLALMTVSASVTNVTAAGAMTVSVETTSCSAGETVELPVALSGNTGFCNLSIEIGYDSSVMTLISAATDAAVGATCTAAQTLTKNPYNISWDSSTANNNYNGTLVTLTFEVDKSAAEGEYPVTVSYYKGIREDYIDGEDVNYDLTSKPLGLSYLNGSVTVTKESKVIEVKAEYNAALGETNVSVDLEADEVYGYIIAAAHDENGRLVSVDLCEASEKCAFDLTGTNQGYKITVMWWGELSRITPLTEPVTVIPEQ